MTLLVDSNALVWWLTDAPDLSRRARVAIAGNSGTTWVSAISVYELQVKARKGLLPGLPSNLGAVLAAQKFSELQVSIAHAELAAELPMHHRDPWDRLLAAQAILENLSIVSADGLLARYGARVVW